MLYESAYVSLIIQFIVGLINIYGVNINVTNNNKIIKDILKVELGVQIIEFIFYVWMIINFKLIKNITPYRYLDWIITTPTMLITLMSYLNNKEDYSLKEFLSKNKSFEHWKEGVNVFKNSIIKYAEREQIKIAIGKTRNKK